MTMIKLNLKSNYKTVQEGQRLLEITGAKVTPSGKPNKLQLNMKDVQDGATLINSYNFDNETSMWAMGMMLSVALGLEDGDDFDTKDVDKLIGIQLLCEVAHSEYNGKTYANIKRIIGRSDVNNENIEITDTTDVIVEENTDDIMKQIDNMYSRSALDEDDLD